ncbi:MAG: glutathione S-transferase family protein [Polyangiaceae bacterium]|nr:glutathione S-transferase family protein [Polyangiaceae bacterium]
MSLTFYYAPQSSASPTHWILEELAIPYEKVLVDLKNADRKKEVFAKVNPNAKVPVIVHDETTIFESVAIAIYLGETFGVERGLFPAAGPSRGKAIQWLVWCNVSLHEAMSRMFWASNDRIPKEMHNAALAAAGKAEVARLLGILNAELDGKEYLVDDKFSIVDAHLCSWVEYVSICGVDMTGYAAIGAWSKRCLARPAAAVQ